MKESTDVVVSSVAHFIFQALLEKIRNKLEPSAEIRSRPRSDFHHSKKFRRKKQTILHLNPETLTSGFSIV